MKKIAALLIIVLIAFMSYGIYRKYAPPKIIIEYPITGQTLDEPIIHLKGQVLRANKIFIYDKEVTFDQYGYFDTIIPNTYPITTIKIEARNKYDVSTYYEQSFASSFDYNKLQAKNDSSSSEDNKPSNMPDDGVIDSAETSNNASSTQ